VHIDAAMPTLTQDQQEKLSSFGMHVERVGRWTRLRLNAVSGSEWQAFRVPGRPHRIVIDQGAQLADSSLDPRSTRLRVRGSVQDPAPVPPPAGGRRVRGRGGSAFVRAGDRERDLARHCPRRVRRSRLRPLHTPLQEPDRALVRSARGVHRSPPSHPGDELGDRPRESDDLAGTHAAARRSCGFVGLSASDRGVDPGPGPRSRPHDIRSVHPARDLGCSRLAADPLRPQPGPVLGIREHGQCAMGTRDADWPRRRYSTDPVGLAADLDGNAARGPHAVPARDRNTHRAACRCDSGWHGGGLRGLESKAAAGLGGQHTLAKDGHGCLGDLPDHSPVQRFTLERSPARQQSGRFRRSSSRHAQRTPRFIRSRAPEAPHGREPGSQLDPGAHCDGHICRHPRAQSRFRESEDSGASRGHTHRSSFTPMHLGTK